jgi:hypothetical protein
MDHATVSWIAQNMGDLYTAQGRLEVARPYVEEAMASARLLGEAGRIAGCLGSQGMFRLAVGDRTAAAAEVAESRRLASVIEPQAAIFFTMSDAILGWPEDPRASCRSISKALHAPEVALGSLIDAAPLAARMAVRVGDTSLLHDAVGSFVELAARCGGPLRMLERRWMEALTGDPATASTMLREVAEEFEAIQYLLPAANCHADAALLARRANQDPGADEAAARRLYEACGAVPILGDLPEERWSAAAEATTRPV